MPQKTDEYTDEELAKIKEQWLKDKAQIDANPIFEYYYDQEKETSVVRKSSLQTILLPLQEKMRWPKI